MNAPHQRQSRTRRWGLPCSGYGVRFWRQTVTVRAYRAVSISPSRRPESGWQDGLVATYVLPKTTSTGEHPAADKINSFSALASVGATRRVRTGDPLITNPPSDQTMSTHPDLSRKGKAMSAPRDRGGWYAVVRPGLAPRWHQRALSCCEPVACQPDTEVPGLSGRKLNRGNH